MIGPKLLQVMMIGRFQKESISFRKIPTPQTHIAATPAEAILPEQVDQSVLEKEKEVFVAQARESGKPEHIIEKMVSGRIQKFLKEICVSSQPFVKDPQRTVQQLVDDKAKELGVELRFDSFAKFNF